ncbi:MAG: vacuolar membrane-associated protein iml1 [Cirrosporium novae-zelandiae]|nr:MAG: vacuolar membrane-associated protein iml1 [Cirrosporium novae-zelandiae]
MPNRISTLRGLPRVSHLRQWSTGSPEAESVESLEQSSQRSHFEPVQRLCSIWVHDESFSKEDILFNAAALGDGAVRADDLLAVSAVLPTTSVRQFEPLAPSQKRRSLLSNDFGDKSAVITHGEPIERGAEEPQKSFLFVARDISPEVKARYPNLQISVTSSIAATFGFRNRSQVIISTVDKSDFSASHIELTFRDAYLARADMWRLAMAELAGKALYSGQKITFMGTIKTTVKNIYLDGQRLRAGFFSASTIPIFRSESARYVLFIQMSKEMWDFDSEGSGEIMFNRVINGFLPELFKRWAKINARHLVSIVMFTRLEYNPEVLSNLSDLKAANKTPSLASSPGTLRTKDYYRVVVSEMASIQWTKILDQLKREFKIFLRDVSIEQVESHVFPNTLQSSTENSSARIVGQPSTAPRGNILEAINLAASQYSLDYIDRDLVRTGVSVVVITPGTGVFEVDNNMLALTTERLVNNAIGIDLVCLSRMPLHSVPLFMFKPFEGDKESPRLDSDTVGSTLRIGRPPIGSYSSRRSGISPSRFSYGSSPIIPKTILPNQPRRGWSFVIPHWIDVSFWNSDDNSYGHRFTNNYLGYAKSTKVKTSKVFVPRVRLYELQMMGVMENEMSNISIPYMGEPYNSLQTKKSASNQSSLGEEAKPIDDQQDGQPFLYGAALTKKASLEGSSSLMSSSDGRPLYGMSSSERLRWLDEYDMRTFRFPSESLPIQHPATIDKGVPLRHSLSRKTRDGNTSLFGTSPRALIGIEKKKNQQIGEEFKARGRGVTSRQAGRSGSSSSQARKKDNTGLRPKKAARQISFGLHGIGIGLGGIASKASASTEINHDHAKAGMPTLLRRPSSQRSISSSTEASSIVAEKLNTSSPKTQPKAQQLPSIPKLEPLKRKGPRPDSTSPASGSSRENIISNSKPIDIKGAAKPEIMLTDRAGPLVEAGHHMSSLEHPHRNSLSALQFATRARQGGPRIDRPHDTKPIDTPQALSPAKALLPWLTPINPANPKKDENYSPLKFGTWQHVHPRRIPTSVIKWKSLCSPAALPLTTEDFPTEQQIANEYTESPYRIAQDEDRELAESPSTREHLMREFISFRLSRGFQIVVGSAAAEALGQTSLESLNIFDSSYLSQDGAMVVMTKGSKIHKLLCVTGGEVEMTKLTQRPMAIGSHSKNDQTLRSYYPAVRTMMGSQYITRQLTLFPPLEEYNWNFVDLFLAGHKDHLVDPTAQLRFWRARFVLIPVDPPSSARRAYYSPDEDSEEEVRLEGIFRLTQMWQRYRYVGPEERRFQTPNRSRKDQNPLDIVYQTRNPSDVVAAEMDNSLLADAGFEGRTIQLLPESDLFERSNLSLSKLAQTIQSDRGIRMMDRRWHWRLHYNCFIGVDLTSWLLQNFRDIDTREEAVEFGNVMMENKLFQHVEKRHNFRDGNFFYQICPEFRTPRPESRNIWFGSRKLDRSFPSTPMTDPLTKDSPRQTHSRSDSTADNTSIDSATPTPSRSSKTTLKVILSKAMRYDVDHRRRSDHRELITLHYDRLSNPDNCYHIRIEWLNVTSKLIEDAIVTWATMAEKFGLRFVELPIAEASSITQVHPFRAPMMVKLAQKPPEKQPHNVFDPTSFVPQTKKDRHYYQKAVLRKFNFVLDFEAVSDFPWNVDVTYSWGKPEYRYAQYIHRSGTLLAQITDEGELLFLANRLYNSRSAANKQAGKSEHDDMRRVLGLGREPLERLSPFSSPLVRAIPDTIAGATGQPSLKDTTSSPEALAEEIAAFCRDTAALDRFYSEVLKASVPVMTGPSGDNSIPFLGLPPSVAGRDMSQSPRLGPVRSTENGSVTNSSPRVTGHAGLPLGTSLLIEEEGMTDYAGALLRCYAAEGVVQGHKVFVVGVGKGWGRGLPGVIQEEEEGGGKTKGKESGNEEREKMKIAWRYESLGEFGRREGFGGGARGPQLASTPSSNATYPPTPFTHTFDLSKPLIHAAISSITYLPLPPSPTTPLQTLLTPLLHSLTTTPQTPHRLIIPSLLHPTLYAPYTANPAALLPLLHTLRATLRAHAKTLTAMISLPLTLYPRNTGLVRWTELLADGVLTLQPFPHAISAPPPPPSKTHSSSEKEKEKTLDPQGLLQIHSLPIYTESCVSNNAATEILSKDWAFAMTRRRFVVTPYYLPPADAEEGEREVAGKRADALEF